MSTVIIHADGTDCAHEGDPQATVLDGDGPLCPDGIPVTHVRFNGQLLTLAEAAEVLARFGAALSRAMQPLLAAFAEFARVVSEDSGFRVLARRGEEERQ